MLKRLRIKNFKSWEDTGEMRLAPITVLFGANNAGKSSIAQLLLMLKQTAEDHDNASALNLGSQETRVELGSFAEIIHGHNKSNALGWEIAWESIRSPDPQKTSLMLHSGGEIEYSAEIKWEEIGEEEGREVLQNMHYRYGGCRFGIEVGKSKGGGEYSLLACSEKNTKAKPIRSNLLLGERLRRSFRCHEFPVPLESDGQELRSLAEGVDSLLDFRVSLELLMERVRYLGPLREYPRRLYSCSAKMPKEIGPRGENTVDAIVSSVKASGGHGARPGAKRESLERAIARWLKALGLGDTFRVLKIPGTGDLYQVRLRAKRGGPEVQITDAGLGVSQILPVIAMCYGAPAGSIIILEHPDMRLHPSAQEDLADMLIDAVKTRKIQLIIESHSEHMFLRLQRRIAEAEKLTSEDVSLFHCRKKAKRSELVPLEMSEYGMISNWPENFFGDDFGEIAATHKAMNRRKAKA